MDAVFKGCTLHEALAILEEDDELEPQLLYIEPPDPAILFDEDSADEDEGGFINNLTGRQLNARCEVVLASRSEPRGAGRPSASKTSRTGNRVSDSIRYDGRNHLLVPGGSRRKCGLESCHSQTRLQFNKCNVGLCAACNLQFHTNNT
ncbi:piggyBac transposable element-derived protein 3-like [Maniola jurtina]|uniref:piggyBac transposable element-derived protein 3-like n=2 Tax=Maniola jurtina TaxID=191418 RepID=UPI001E68DD3F|nr:piggyBac transposable element-derived protein 3-like [Maniola jurtina]